MDGRMDGWCFQGLTQLLPPEKAAGHSRDSLSHFSQLLSHHGSDNPGWEQPSAFMSMGVLKGSVKGR